MVLSMHGCAYLVRVGRLAGSYQSQLLSPAGSGTCSTEGPLLKPAASRASGSGSPLFFSFLVVFFDLVAGSSLSESDADDRSPRVSIYLQKRHVKVTIQTPAASESKLKTYRAILIAVRALGQVPRKQTLLLLAAEACKLQPGVVDQTLSTLPDFAHEPFAGAPFAIHKLWAMSSIVCVIALISFQ